jgi:hypothetical protein
MNVFSKSWEILIKLNKIRKAEYICSRNVNLWNEDTKNQATFPPAVHSHKEEIITLQLKLGNTKSIIWVQIRGLNSLETNYNYQLECDCSMKYCADIRKNGLGI